ncbi:MAG: hypothetical protein ABW168_27505 [Sedimenticola sp.]
MNSILTRSPEKTVVRKATLVVFCALLSFSFSAQASLIVNGSFDNQGATAGFLPSGTSNLPGWTIGAGDSGGYTFLVEPGQAGVRLDSESSPSEWPNIALWDIDHPGRDGFTGQYNGTHSIPATSPAGGNFIASDSGFRLTTLYQEITGLEVGANYKLSFWQAAGQQNNREGNTVDLWRVSWGGVLGTVTDITLPNDFSHTGLPGEVYSYDSTEIISGGDVRESEMMLVDSFGFADWKKQTMIFTAADTKQLLGFMALGGPGSQPPFALLDGVELTQVPLPGSLLLMLLGLPMIMRRRRATQA